MKKIIFYFLILCIPIFLYSQTDKKPSIPPNSDFQNDGKISWYGEEFIGKKTSSGEPFDPKSYSAASRDLPFGTKLLVTNLKNNKMVVVKVNDRGPFKGDRVIDISRAAAEALEMIGKGVIDAHVELVDPSVPLGPYDIKKQKPAAKIELTKNNDLSKRILQISSFSSKKLAQSTLKRLTDNNFKAEIEEVPDMGLYRVVIKDVIFTDVDDMKKKLKKIGYSGILVRLQRD